MRIGGGGGGGGIPISTLSPPEGVFIKTGSDESHFHVSLIVKGKVTRQCPQTTTSEEKEEPKRVTEPTSSAYQSNALPLV